MTDKGSFLISLDFEMMWGALDLWTPEGYGQTNVKNVGNVVIRLVDLFNKYGVHSTFAIVGMLMLSGKDECHRYEARNVPSYNNIKLSPYNENFISKIKDESIYFSPSLLNFIKQQKNIEVASHTFSHYYCWEKGQTAEQFEDDTRLAAQVGKDKQLELSSIVFPRNQVSEDYLSVCEKYGFSVYRGISPRFSSQPQNSFHAIMQRLGRLIDVYNPWGESSSIAYNTIDTSKKIINIPSSRFLRPYSALLSFLDNLRFNRIKKEIEYAAKHGEMYHIWWHPHNFGANTDQNIAFLTRILECYKECHEKYGMMSCTMKEMAQMLK